MKKIKRLLLLMSALLLALSGCAEQAAPQDGSFTDALNRSIPLREYSRVVVASGSFAELWQLAGGELLGTTDDAFKNGLSIPAATGNVGSLLSPSVEAIIALSPDLVLLSADISGHTALIETLSSADIAAAAFSVESFDDYLSVLKICTDITGRGDLYAQNGLRIQEQIQGVIAKTKDKPAPKVLFLRAGAGKVSARGSDTMAGIMLRNMGCANITDSDDTLLDNLSMEVIIEQDPDFIFTVTQGDSEENAQKALQDTLLSNPAWANLSAVKNNRCITLPKDLFHLKPNDRWAEAFQMLWDILYGEA
ncbi:MAG: ABC transporter substrate-binding protein [Oscillospiraceae bacterium]|nr:ABC transporter substrate-binding protein [Oscillospiraceae bacterium]